MNVSAIAGSRGLTAGDRQPEGIRGSTGTGVEWFDRNFWGWSVPIPAPPSNSPVRAADKVIGGHLYVYTAQQVHGPSATIRKSTRRTARSWSTSSRRIQIPRHLRGLMRAIWPRSPAIGYSQLSTSRAFQFRPVPRLSRNESATERVFNCAAFRPSSARNFCCNPEASLAHVWR